MRFWIICLLAINALAQSPAPPVRPADAAEDGPLLKINVQLVQVDAVVTGSKGRHLAGLRPADFRASRTENPAKSPIFPPSPAIAPSRQRNPSSLSTHPSPVPWPSSPRRHARRPPTSAAPSPSS